MGYLTHLDLNESFVTGGLPGVTDPLEYISGSRRYGVDGTAYLSAIQSTLFDHQEGDNRPYWFTLEMHASHRAEWRSINTVVSMSRTAMENLENYTIGGGFEYKVKPRHEEQGVETALVARVQAIIDDFIEDNGWNEGGLENQIHNRSRRDGEDFIALYRTGDGVKVRLVKAEHIVEPRGVERRLDEWLDLPHSTNWKYGVHTYDSDIQEPLGYWVAWDTSERDCQYFPANSPVLVKHKTRSGLMHHVKRNVDQGIKRGMGDFFPVGKQLLGDSKLVRNMVTGASTQAAIAWIEQYVKASRDQVAREVGATSDSKQSISDSDGGLRTERQRSVGPGSVLYISEHKEYKPGPMGSDRNSGFEIVAALAARRIGALWCMPEFMISGDASNNNFASSIVSEGPFTKARQKDQRFYSSEFKAVMWKVLNFFVAEGKLTGFGVRTLRDLKRRLKIEVTCPEVATRDKLEDAQAKEIEHEQGVLSTATWQNKTDLDPEAELSNIKREAELGLQPKLMESTVGKVAEMVQQRLWSNWDEQAESYP